MTAENGERTLQGSLHDHASMRPRPMTAENGDIRAHAASSSALQ